MTRQRHDTVRSVTQRLRPSAGSFAAAAAITDPRMLLELHTAKTTPPSRT
jgi:hypothetical protein